MRSVTRRRPAYRWLVLILALDVLGLSSMLLNQWLGGRAWVAWAYAAGLSAASLPWLLRLSDEVFRAACSLHHPTGGRKKPVGGMIENGTI